MVQRRPIPTPLRQRLEDLRRGPLLLVVWTAAAAGCWFLIRHQAGPVSWIALAQPREHEVSVPADGRLADLRVELHQAVEPGQLLGQLDSSLLEARLRTAQAEVRRLDAERRALAEALEQIAHEGEEERAAELRRFHMDEAELALDALDLEVDLEADRIEAERFGIRLAREEKLVAEEVLDQARLDDTRLRHERLLARILHRERLLEGLHEELEEARERRRAFEGRLPDGIEVDARLTALQAAIDVQVLRVRELEVEREGLVLRSPARARVTRILARPGQAVLAGEPILVLTAVEPEAVVAWLPPAVQDPPLPASRALVSREVAPLATAETEVRSLGPGIEELPRRLWRDPAQPEYGRALVLSPPPGLSLVPGERLRVLRAD